MDPGHYSLPVDDRASRSGPADPLPQCLLYTPVQGGRDRQKERARAWVLVHNTIEWILTAKTETEKQISKTPAATTGRVE